MLRYLLASLIVLPLYAEDVTLKTRVVSLLNEQMRLEWCGPAVHIRACTRFIGAQLVTACQQDNATWQMKASARLTALIALRDHTRMGHEQAHLEDMRDSLNAYVATLGTASFPTASDCEASGLKATQGFEATIQTFATASNTLRDGFARR